MRPPSEFTMGTHYSGRCRRKRGVMKHSDLADLDCSIAQALGVVGDWWTLLVIRDVAGGLPAFVQVQRELSISRKTLTERLKSLVAHGVLDKVHYSKHPPRYEYHLTQ